VGSVYLLTLRQLSGRWRVLIMTLLAAMPVLITAIALAANDAPSVDDFEGFVLSALLAGAIAPLVLLAIAAPAFANELEDRTLANLTITPLPRWQIVLPKLLGAISIAAPFIAASALATSYIAFLGDPRAMLAVTLSALVGVALYASAFTWLGLVTTQAIGVGLFYIVLWEGFFARFISGVRILSIRYYALALMHGLDDRRFAALQHLGLGAALIVCALIMVGFTWLAIRRLRTMDVP
jgi:ABC-2 type transport system permease protein